MQLIHISNVHRAYIEGLLNRMLSEYEHRGDYSDINIKNCIQELIIFLIRYKHHKSNEYIKNINMTDALMQEASDMLLETNESISEIALKCGFNDSDYFGNAFKKVKDISPLKYRKNNKYV